MLTPWGKADGQTRYAEGITFYETPSHGGFHLSRERIDQVHPALRGLSNYPDAWYEEDCAYAVIPYTFPEAFLGRVGSEADETIESIKSWARGILERWYPEELAKAEREMNHDSGAKLHKRAFADKMQPSQWEAIVYLGGGSDDVSMKGREGNVDEVTYVGVMGTSVHIEFRDGSGLRIVPNPKHVGRLRFSTFKSGR